MRESSSFFNIGFISLNLLILFTFTNLALFFSFYNFLNDLSINASWYGLIIGAFSATAIFFRPFISMRLKPDNAIIAMAIGLLLMFCALLLYQFVDTLTNLILLRIIHGLGYVFVLSAGITLVIFFMPANKSGQGFGLTSLMIILPYAIIPLLLEKYLSAVALTTIYTYAAFLMLPPMALLYPISLQLKKSDIKSLPTTPAISWKDLLKNLRRPEISIILLSTCLTNSIFTILFFFITTFFATTDNIKPALFFTISTIVNICLRIFLSQYFDKYNKKTVTMLSLAIISLGLALLLPENSPSMFFGAAILFGIGYGIAVPLLNSLMFSVSQPEHRAINANLMLEMADTGFFIGPALCGFALANGFDKPIILKISIALIGLIILLISIIKIEVINNNGNINK